MVLPTVTAPCDFEWLPFATTNDLPVLDAVFGQERAVRAIEFALGANVADVAGAAEIIEILVARAQDLVAERLGVPGLTWASKLDIEGTTVTIRRDSDDASTTITAGLPALVSVTDQTGEARYPSFKGIMAAKKKPVTTWSLADLGLDASQVGLTASWSVVAGANRRPPRSAGTVVADEGDGGLKLAEYLSAGKFI